MGRRCEVFKFGESGWLSHLQQKRKKGSFAYTIRKEVVSAFTLRRGQPLFSYTASELETNRLVLITYLDGKERDGASDEVDEWKEQGGGSYAERKVSKE